MMTRRCPRPERGTCRERRRGGPRKRLDPGQQRGQALEAAALQKRKKKVEGALECRALHSWLSLTLRPTKERGNCILGWGMQDHFPSGNKSPLAIRCVGSASPPSSLPSKVPEHQIVGRMMASSLTGDEEVHCFYHAPRELVSWLV